MFYLMSTKLDVNREAMKSNYASIFMHESRLIPIWASKHRSSWDKMKSEATQEKYWTFSGLVQLERGEYKLHPIVQCILTHSSVTRIN